MRLGTWFRVGVGAWLCGAGGCGDDGGTASAGGTSSASTGGETGGVPTSGGDATTSAGSTSGVSATGGGTTGGPTTGDDTTGETGDDTTGDTGDDTTGPAPFCGDGTVDAGEECDDGANNSDTGACTTACALAKCGDGLVGPGEACDDADADDGDECTNACALASCGDGVLQMGEACDDGDDDDTDECLATCVLPSCGDGLVFAGVEECDDANLNEGDDCSLCKVATCEDGLKNGGESDLDCGGPCGGCGLDQGCGGQADCGPGLLCDGGECGVPQSCKQLKAADPDVASGEVMIDPDGDGPGGTMLVYCEQTALGGGWTRLMSAKYPFFFADANWQDHNADDPGAENYSIMGLRDLFKDGVNYTYRYSVGDEQTWLDGPILFDFAWTQGHDAFTATTNGGDYTFLGGDEPTTCGGFNGLHNKYNSPSYATDVDVADGVGCWWMQVVPRSDWKQYGYPPGYLHGFLGGGNLNPEHETQWEVLYIRE